MNRTLLRFPGGDAQSPIACTYCPEMCRFSCPTAVVSGNDAVTPCNKNSLLYKEQEWPGQSAKGGELWPIYDCTGCGRCTEYCVYEMPVADQLFEARKKYVWSEAREAAAQMIDAMDPVGDLADELGDAQAADRRRKSFVGAAQGGLAVDEPRSLFYLGSRQVEASLTWQDALHPSFDLKPMLESLRGKRWLVHESVWLSRRLGRVEEVADFLKRSADAGVEWVTPFHHGMDCIDCGGEGAYGLMFPDQSNEMAREIWERDRHRADGVFCFSKRCASHLRTVLGPSVPVQALSEWCE